MGARSTTATDRPAAPPSRAECASPPSASARPTSSSDRSSRAVKASFPPSWSTSSRSVAIKYQPSRSRRCAASSKKTSACRWTRSSPSSIHAARRGIDRAGAPRPCSPGVRRAVRRRWSGADRAGRGRGQGAAAASGRSRATRSGRVGLARAVPRRPHPDRRAGQPAGAGRGLRRDDLRGARLPPRSREHARRRADARRTRTARLCHPPPAPHAGHAGGCS